MLQFRPMGSNGPMYAPHRDLAYCGIDVIQSGINCMEYLMFSGSAELKQFLKDHDIDDNKLSRIIIQLGTILTEAYQKPNPESQARTLEKLINEEDVPSRLFLLSCIGISFLFHVVHGIQDVVFNKEVPENLKEFAENAKKYMLSSIACRRPLYRCVYDKICDATDRLMASIMRYTKKEPDNRNEPKDDNNENSGS